MSILTKFCCAAVSAVGMQAGGLPNMQRNKKCCSVNLGDLPYSLVLTNCPLSVSFFAGLCLERPGCECKPKRTRKTKVSVIIGTNASSTFQMCSHAEVSKSKSSFVPWILFVCTALPAYIQGGVIDQFLEERRIFGSNPAEPWVFC